MKRKLFGLGVVVILAAVSSFLFTTCASVGGGGLAVVGHYSFPQVYLTSGVVRFSSVFDPVTGEDVEDATITATNTTTAASVNLTYQADPIRGYYRSTDFLFHDAGEKVALNIVTADGTLTGSDTVTPDTDVGSLSPTTGATVSLSSLTVSWKITTNTYNATHVWVSIYDGSDSSNTYQELLPIGTTSLEVDSSMIQPGTFIISVGAVNRMSIQGASSGSFAVVGSTGAWAASTNVAVQF